MSTLLDVMIQVCTCPLALLTATWFGLRGLQVRPPKAGKSC